MAFKWKTEIVSYSLDYILVDFYLSFLGPQLKTFLLTLIISFECMMGLIHYILRLTRSENLAYYILISAYECCLPRKQAVTSRNQELLAIESKIKETEERLRKANNEVIRSSNAELSETSRERNGISDAKHEVFRSPNSKSRSDMQPKVSRSPNSRRPD